MFIQQNSQLPSYKNMYKTLVVIFVLCLMMISFVSAQAKVIDYILFGDHESEMAHQFESKLSEVVDGGMGIKARRLLPDGEQWRGGRIESILAIDSVKTNYVTVMFWGDDYAPKQSRLMLFADGKQVGQRHLGDVDSLDICSEHPRFKQRFFYRTVPLPESMTVGQNKMRFAIEGQGRVWGYGSQIEKFQHAMNTPSRGIYGMFIHNDPYWQPNWNPKWLTIQSDLENVAKQINDAPRRSHPGESVLDEVKQRVNHELDKQMRYSDDMRQVFIQFLAKAYHTPWTNIYQDRKALEKIVRGIDSRYRVFIDNPDIIKSDRATWNHDWFGYGPTADAVRLLKPELEPFLNQNVIGTDIPRRKAWADMFVASRDWHVTTRRQYTNQSMIKDTFGIYLCDRAVAFLQPDRAWPKQKAIGLLYESAGLEPWSGSWDQNGQPSWPLGRDYYQLTQMGLTKELGYVGNYGEVIDWMVAMYESTRPSVHEEGDLRLKEQLIKAARARGIFRYPLVDHDGYRAMQLETVIGWRDDHYPGGVTYDQRFSWDGGPLEAAAATLDPVLVGYAQQMLDDNQYFVHLENKLKESNFRITVNLLVAPENYKAVKGYPKQKTKLPMADGQPDFIFADPEIGTVAIKNGDDILYASLYWRARYAINHLARVHHLTPVVERDAIVRQQTRFVDSGLTYTLPNQTNEAQSTRHEKFYQQAGMRLAGAGDVQPIAYVPDTVKGWKPGRENVFAGKGTFYVMEYGDYLIAMNCSPKRAYRFEVPSHFAKAVDLSGNLPVISGKLRILPGQTVVLLR